ncbi:MAG: methyl-accepting chemotaxis protein [Pseudomonadota bacterium]|nr:methyl-accepting chemotaxis protein [Pseudomonadota bacterium]
MIHRLGLRHAFAAFGLMGLILNLAAVGSVNAFAAGSALACGIALLLANAIMIAAGAAIGARYAQRAETIVGALNVFAKGDLSCKLKLDGKDDFAWLAHEYDNARRGIVKLVEAISGASHDVVGSVDELDRSTEQIAHSSGEQSSASLGIASAMEQATVSIRRVAEAAEEAGRIAEHASELATQGKLGIESLIREIEGTSGTVQQSSGVIAELGRKSETVSSIVQTIKGIADQTNLLALNAAIEAARAGEQGRGFAVVADEVRKLAERSSSAANDITQMIASMVSGTQQAVSGMEQCVRRVDAGVQIARQAGQSVQALDDSAHRTRGQVDDIAAAMREQAQAADAINEHVELISRMSEDNRNAVLASQQAVRRLGELSASLGGAVAGFRAR